jgi:hypothetical protein
MSSAARSKMAKSRSILAALAVSVIVARSEQTPTIPALRHHNGFTNSGTLTTGEKTALSDNVLVKNPKREALVFAHTQWMALSSRSQAVYASIPKIISPTRKHPTPTTPAMMVARICRRKTKYGRKMSRKGLILITRPRYPPALPQ